MAEIKKKSNCALGCDEKSNQIFGEGDGRKGGEFGGELIPPKKKFLEVGRVEGGGGGGGGDWG